MKRTRRDFFRIVAAAAGASAMPLSIRRALAIPPHRVTGTIQDVEHVVILMQENRSFDHYFGTMRGVRGFNDPRPARLPNGKPVWYQPPAETKTHRYHARGLSDSAEHVLPFYLNPKQTTEFQAGTDHGWSSGHLSWNHGHHNQWVNQKQDVITMGYLRREDVSFHYALADAFTVCDAYHCSIHADTCPNRIYLWSGTIDARNALGKKPNGPGIEERSHTNGYTWTTYPERLEKAGVSWKLYQGGSGEPGTPTDNYTDNSLEFFAAYQVKEGADPHGPLVQKGVTDRTLREFREDVANNRLAQVNWIVAPYKYSEHPEASPTDGAYYINLVLDALTSNPEMWSKTVFILNYDENDGLFDHVLPPMPPHTQAQNASGMVSAELVDSLKDEFLDLNKYPHEMTPLVPGADPGGLQPIGLGVRLPMVIASPWTRGGWVCSETFDHTSVLRFLEARFGIEEPNISAWRRSICGDLTSAFDFAGTPDGKPVKFTAPAPLNSAHKPWHVPAVQEMPAQEPGTRPSRALPYEIYAHSRVEDGRVWVDFTNAGKAGMAFYAFNGLAVDTPPRRYSIAAGDKLADYWPLEEGKYRLALWGPHGYHSEFRGNAAELPGVEVAVAYDQSSGNVTLTVTNTGAKSATVKIANAYAPDAKPREYTVAAGASQVDRWDLGASHSWFDLSVTSPDSPEYLRRYAGHVETGRPSVSDPGLFREA
ncbi:phosphocholine-specific phospholipase C [Silvibacterium dinghuense]|uniref:phospholipase C n=1 Tax=Silvibacterium dinghuense TaxID=1560006 RepID=A0A4Q1SDU3_9BACT|nr:phospholipase C, phosphocholine-specific [Silvibacterium dinghuense]RXS95283.1 phospholipase C, phosphocholine-specific [Silvibacterium dinghuense]GGH12134.1 non-hemolytic phospholipase C [Silvibacterium dinghuense]